MLYGAEVLAKPSQPVTQISGAEVQLVKDMIETMYKAPGVGLAAPQVGIGQRIMVTDPSAGEKRNQLITIVNPEIIESEGEQTEDEGCLSIPGFSAVVLRPRRVVLKGLDLNGKEIHVSTRAQLSEAMLSVGLAKTSTTINAGLPLLEQMAHRARKCRLLGSAALDLAYIACGRLDAYIEQGISLWDIAAGWLLVENAGGRVELRPRSDMPDKFGIVASNGLIDLGL